MLTASTHPEGESGEGAPRAELGSAVLVSSFAPSATGLCVTGSPDRESWQRYGALLGAKASSLQWLIGDWLDYALRTWRDGFDVFAAAEDATGLKYQALADARWVASRFECSRRRETLTFQHHREVASLHPDQADDFLEHAASTRPVQSVRALRDRVSKLRPPRDTDGESDPIFCNVRRAAIRLAELVDALPTALYSEPVRVLIGRLREDMQALDKELDQLAIREASRALGYEFGPEPAEADDLARGAWGRGVG
jgi:hypothetical protein